MSVLARPDRPFGREPAVAKKDVVSLARRALLAPGVLLLVAWLLLIALLTVRLPYFLTVTNAISILNFSAVTFVAAAGFTIALVGGGIDLSVGSVVMITGVTAGTLFLGGVPLSIAFLIGFAVGPLIGLVNGLLVTRLRINPLIATLSMLFVVRGIGFYVAASKLRQVRSQDFRFARIYEAGLPLAVWILIVVGVVAWVLLRFTKLGRHLQAIGGNSGAARQAAMDVERYRLLLYVIAGAFSGVAGILLASVIGAADPNSGEGREFSVATAVLLGGASLSGGRGSILGTLIGVLFVTTLSNGLTQMGALPEIVLIVNGVLLIAAVAFDQRPKGGYR
jgi:ribose/xylose/arabinose/galactoside ABC-type transport system permease subunit